MAAIVSFVGKSGTGKTTLIEAAIKELKTRGFRVAVIKHAHHGFEMDKPGKDTWRFPHAGSDMVLVSSPGKVAIIEQVADELSYEEAISRIYGNVDIILVEGFKRSSKVKVDVTGNERGNDVLKVVDFLVEQIQQGR